VVIVGAVNLPTDIYFLEAALVGNYVKYSSNVDFDLPEGVEGVDTHILWLMNSFTHWSFQESFGKILICDLQGVSPVITILKLFRWMKRKC
jgi:hypothetical protein